MENEKCDEVQFFLGEGYHYCTPSPPPSLPPPSPPPPSPPDPPFPPPPSMPMGTCPHPTIHVVTHDTQDNEFWATWKQGAETAASQGRATLEYVPVGLDVAAATAAIGQACQFGHALVITVPYREGSDEYAALDEAINACLDADDSHVVFTANTDTYHNERVFAYVGSNNYLMGEACGRATVFEDPDVILGRKPPEGAYFTKFAELSKTLYVYLAVRMRARRPSQP